MNGGTARTDGAASVTKVHAFLLPPHVGSVQTPVVVVVVVLLYALSDTELLKNRTEKPLLSPQQSKTHKNQWGHFIITQVSFSGIQSHLDIRVLHGSGRCKSDENKGTALTSGLWFQLRPK